MTTKLKPLILAIASLLATTGAMAKRRVPRLHRPPQLPRRHRQRSRGRSPHHQAPHRSRRRIRKRPRKKFSTRALLPAVIAIAVFTPPSTTTSRARRSGPWKKGDRAGRPLRSIPGILRRYAYRDRRAGPAGCVGEHRQAVQDGSAPALPRAFPQSMPRARIRNENC